MTAEREPSAPATTAPPPDPAEFGRRRRAGRRRRREARRLRTGLARAVRGRGLRPARAIAALVAEDRLRDGHAGAPEAGRCTYGEAVVLGAARRRAQARVDRGTRRVERLARRCERLDRAGAAVHRRIPDGTARRRELDEVAARIAADGGARHERPPRWIRATPAAIAVLDFVVLLHFTAGVFNVDPAAPASLPGLVSLLFALLGTGVSFAWLSLTGERLRAVRDARGEPVWSAVTGATRVCVVMSVALVGTLAVLMYVRVSDEIVNAGAVTGSGGAPLMAGVFAVLSVGANLSVVAVHALDGSARSRHRDALHRAVAREERRRRRLLQRAGRLQDRRAVTARRARRVATSTLVAATSDLVTAVLVVDAARALHARHGAGAPPSQVLGSPAAVGHRGLDGAPPLDTRTLSAALAEAQRPGRP